MLPLEEAKEHEELVLEVAQLEQRGRVVAVLALGAAAFLLVAGADGALFGFVGFVFLCLVAEALDAEVFERVGEFLSLGVLVCRSKRGKGETYQNTNGLFENAEDLEIGV